MPQNEQPAVIYRLIAAADWNAAEREGYVLYQPHDLADGFLHLSTREQVLESAAKYFSGRTDMMALEIDAAMLGARVKYEPSRGGALFPHLYGSLCVSAVIRARPLREEAGAFRFTDEGA